MVDAVREGQGHRGSTPLTSTISVQLFRVPHTHARARSMSRCLVIITRDERELMFPFSLATTNASVLRADAWLTFSAGLSHAKHCAVASPQDQFFTEIRSLKFL